MSDVSGGPGWWQASDGKWYPPQSAPPPPTAQTPKEARLQAKAEKARAKALRPWYRKKRWWTLAAIIALIVIIVVSVGNSATKKHTVTYSVTGVGTTTAEVITYYTIQQGNGQSGESQATNAPLPWTKTITASGLFTDFSVSAQNAGSGSITCTITEDGQKLNTNTANGSYAIASCTATGKS